MCVKLNLKKRGRREARAVQLEADGQEQQSLQRLTDCRVRKGSRSHPRRARIHGARSVCGRGESCFAVQKLEVVPTFSMQRCEELTEKLEASFKAAAEMAKE